jgi:hypothetical protein
MDSRIDVFPEPFEPMMRVRLGGISSSARSMERTFRMSSPVRLISSAERQYDACRVCHQANLERHSDTVDSPTRLWRLPAGRFPCLQLAHLGAGRAPHVRVRRFHVEHLQDHEAPEGSTAQQASPAGFAASASQAAEQLSVAAQDAASAQCRTPTRAQRQRATSPGPPLPSAPLPSAPLRSAPLPAFDTCGHSDPSASEVHANAAQHLAAPLRKPEATTPRLARAPSART